MAYTEIAIDLGTSYTSIYLKGEGLVLREPSVVVASGGASGGARSIKAIGIEAKKLIGKTPENTTVIFPIFEGAVVNANVATIMLDYFLQKLMPGKIARPKFRALVNIPCGLNSSERKLFESVIYSGGVKEAIFLESPIASAFGCNAPMTRSEPCLVVDIGGGTTDIGVLNLGGVIAGCSVGIGGNNVDTGIIDHVADTFSLKIGLLSAERAKTQAGSLFLNDTTSALVNGRDIISFNPRSEILDARSLIDVIEYYYYRVLDVVESVIHSLPEEVAAEIQHSGVYICGGASQIAGLDKAFKKYLNLDVNIAEEPSYSAILGAGQLLSQSDLLKAFTSVK